MHNISQLQFEKLLPELAQEKLLSEQKLSLACFLNKYGFSAELMDINFSVPDAVISAVVKSLDETIISDMQVPRPTTLLQDIDFTGCTIKNCQFDKCDLSNGVFEDLVIESCSFNQTIFNHITIKNTHFCTQTGKGACSFIGASFDYGSLDEVVFEACILDHTTLNYLKKLGDVTFKNSHLSHISLVGGAQAQTLSIDASDPEKYEIIDLTTDKHIHFVNVKSQKNYPSVLIPWNNKEPGMFSSITEVMLENMHLNPVRMDYNPTVNAKALNDEIDELCRLTHITQLKDISFTMQLIKTMREMHAVDPAQFPEMHALYEHAKCMFEQVDGVVIPGGQDIDPRFYGQDRFPQTKLRYFSQNLEFVDARRDVIEFCLIYLQQLARAPKPLAGICRGSQVVAVAYGGMLYQHLGADERTRLYLERVVLKSTSSPTSLLSLHQRIATTNDDDAALMAMFQHHQGYDLMKAKGLESIALTQISSGITIDVLAENLSQNITITQPHVELAFDQNEHHQKTNTGIARHVTSHLANQVFGQFTMRVYAYVNSEKILASLQIKNQMNFFKKEEGQEAQPIPLPPSIKR